MQIKNGRHEQTCDGPAFFKRDIWHMRRDAELEAIKATRMADKAYDTLDRHLAEQG